MRSTLILFVSILMLSSCEPETQNNFAVQGTIKGLKVGTIALQKVQDSTLITLDSVVLDGQSDYRLTYNLEEPELLYLYLDVKDGSKYDDRIAFFAEDTIMTINSNLKNYEKDAVISGSKNQELLEAFKANTSKLDLVYTDLMRRSMELSKVEDPATADIEALNTEYDKYLRKRILYALNYASVHKENEVAPFILLQEGFDANPKLLDSIYMMMPKKIQTSLYGKDLSEMIQKAKLN
ncbi:hypothetical protein AAU57_14445 [Nonlabens sp. YIK11]|uniref:DUF4369 domain-containing protein n=1 Tax=Nonlabens sp. YIK11 TaxID=1453349 RepID=UPI0006DC1022|nr:DUF4369 domain-containing protein [Nonlabens sp. YIK11]KQC34405.1 hypothetical protein AAU57_14445 [Nonlabens sp. YIK11]